MKSIVIKTDHLTKYYGKHRGIIDVNLEVQEGEIFGYLGPNGAGKTTTIRIIMDFIRADRGSVSVFNRDSRFESVRIHQKMGYLPGELALYRHLTVGEFLHYAGNLRGGIKWNDVEVLSDRLKCQLNQKIRTLSHGNKQKVGLIQALMHKPELLILDEPTNGLDPLIQHEFYELISEIKGEGRTVFLSSHNLSEVERMCDRVGIIRSGRIVAVDDISKLQLRGLYNIEIHFTGTVAVDDFKALKNIRALTIDGTVLKCQVMGDMDPLIKCASKFRIKNLTSHQPGLEEVFLAHYGEQNDVS